MWIKWTQPRMLGIPAGKDKILNIMPGYQFVDDKSWKLARTCVERKIQKKMILEIEPQVQTGIKGAGGKDMPDSVVGTDFKDLKADLQEAIVSECYSIPCLTLLKQQAPESLRILINNQIEEMTKRPAKRN